MSTTQNNNTTTALPTPVAPLVDEAGQITVPWRAWFQELARRVGSADGFVLPSGVSWTSGNGIPTTDQPQGSLYSRLDAGVAIALYLSSGGGVWRSVA